MNKLCCVDCKIFIGLISNQDDVRCDYECRYYKLKCLANISEGGIRYIIDTYCPLATIKLMFIFYLKKYGKAKMGLTFCHLS